MLPEETRGNKKKFDLAQKKENTIRSLLEVDHFLCALNKGLKGAKLYKILKK